MDTNNAENKPHYRSLEDHGRLTADEMDEQRKRNIAYEYLCHLEEAKVWIQACINEDLPTTTELEEGLRNGVFLAKLGHFFAPSVAPLKKIYDKDQARYTGRGLHFRHTDNIVHWLRAMEDVGLPKIFYPETTDIYDKKNMPRAVYCVHALSLYLFRLGLAPQIQDLYGKIKFTEEEISAMRSELDKYGIQMPAFSKIGGILANEMTVDDAALHAAIIAINEAVENKVATETMAALRNPSAMLVNLDPEVLQHYQDQLLSAKHVKAENARNKSIDPERSYEHDVYDELLTQAEIQGNVNKVNTTVALNKINDALLKGNLTVLLAALKAHSLGLKDVQDDNIEYYAAKLLEAREMKKNNNNGEDVLLDKEELQQAINQANLEASSEYKKAQAVKSINAAIDSNDADQLFKAFQNSQGQFPQVFDFAAPLYLEELASIKGEKQDELDFDEISAALMVLNAVAAINQAVDAGDPTMTFHCLCEPAAHLPEVEENIADNYQTSLSQQKRQKLENGGANPLLTHGDIMDCIETVHHRVQEEQARIEAINLINEAIEKGDADETLAALQCPAAKLNGIDQLQADHYLNLLTKEKASKAQRTKDEAAVLWLEEIQSTVNQANKNAEEGLKISKGVQAANQALQDNDAGALVAALTSQAGFQSVKPECAATYLDKLKHLQQEKAAAGECGSGWMMNRVGDGSKFFYNIHTEQFAWTRTDDVIKDFSLLTKEEIQGVVSEVTAEHNRQMLYKANEETIVLVQARARGYLQRKAYQERKQYLHDQGPAVTTIQAYWRGHKQRQAYGERRQYLRNNLPAIVKLQSLVRMWRDRKRYRDRLKFFKDNEDKIIKIQAFFRSNLARQDYKALMQDDNPSLAVVRKFVHLLDASDNDYAEELELQKLRQQVVTEIRSNQQLERDLDQMDIKIGLLIKNRITLQDVVTHNRKLTKRSDDGSSSVRGLKALSRESHERMEAYQHLFYLLQTNPTYLAKLIFEMPQSKTTKFMEAVIFSLFNYGANQREEYLLLRLFRTALEEEINSKVDRMTDIVTGNPLVVKMIVGFNRNQRGQNNLKEMLSALITTVIEDRNLRINTNPVEVYKAWINQLESTTGKTSELPYDVSTEQALKHPEVLEQIEASIAQLQGLTDQFLNKILTSLDSIPYGMRYMARVMKAALVKKFPDAPEKEVLKIVGNLLYYRYINSAIVAPDAFDIVNIGAEKALSPDQRRNLGSIAKILQFCASNKGFGGESAYLSSMNDYIRQSHEKFKKYCLSACEVEEPEVRFNVDQYSDVIMITKPAIYISVGEIVDTHSLLLQHQEIIAPDHDDPLHDLLMDLGEAPTIDELLGTELTGDEATNETLRAQLAKTEISMVLSARVEVQHDEKADLKSLLIRTKRMIVDVIACQPGDQLTEILDKPASTTQEEKHQALVKKRDLLDKKLVRSEKAGSAKIVRHASVVGDTRLPLEMMKTKIRNNLRELELASMVSHRDHYQDLINSIVQDIRNQRRYRNNRKQELLRVRNTLNSLNEKRTFYESQIDYYNQYVKTCMDSLQNKNKKPKKTGFFHRRSAAQTTVKSVHYNAVQLREKGVILEIESLPPNQFKNVLFEISATENPGVFDVNAKFMGVGMDKVELVFQDLLQLQYDGVAVMKMFNRAKVNVNLLIFLLNKKFYGKQLGK